jgi:hypothetical protein
MATPYTGPKGPKDPKDTKKTVGVNFFPRSYTPIWHPNYPGGKEKSANLNDMYLAAGQKTPLLNCTGGQQCAGQVNTMEQNDLQTVYDSLYGKGIKKAIYRKGDAWDMKPEEYTMWEDEGYKTQLAERKKSGLKTPFVYNSTLPPAILFEPIKEGEEDKWEGKRVILDRANDEIGDGTEGSYHYAKDTPYYKGQDIIPAEHTGTLGKLQKHPKTGEWGRYLYHGYSTSTKENPDGTTKPGQAKFKADWISATDGVGYSDGQNKYSFVRILGNNTLDKAKSDLKQKKLKEQQALQSRNFWQNTKPIEYNQGESTTVKPIVMSKKIPSTSSSKNKEKKDNKKNEKENAILRKQRTGSSFTFRYGGIAKAEHGWPYPVANIDRKMGLEDFPYLNFNPNFNSGPQNTGTGVANIDRKMGLDDFLYMPDPKTNAIVPKGFSYHNLLDDNLMSNIDRKMALGRNPYTYIDPRLMGPPEDTEEYDEEIIKPDDIMGELDRTGKFEGQDRVMNLDKKPFVPGEDPDDPLLNSSSLNITFPKPDFSKFGGQEYSVDGKKKGYDADKAARRYHAGMLAMDAATLFSNAIQQPPPRLSVEKTYFQPYDLDTTPFDTARKNLGANLNMAFRHAREGASQQADLSRIASSLATTGARGLGNIADKERQALDKERMMNIELTNKGVALRDQQQDRERMLNWERMAKFAMQKGDTLGKNLTSVKQSIKNMADYDIKKDHIDKMEAYSKEQTDKQNEISKAALKISLYDQLKGSSGYKLDLENRRKGVLDTVKGQIQEEFGQGIPSAAETKQFEASIATQQKKYDDLVNTLKPEPQPNDFVVSEEPQFENYKDLIPKQEDYGKTMDLTSETPQGNIAQTEEQYNKDPKSYDSSQDERLKEVENSPQIRYAEDMADLEGYRQRKFDKDKAEWDEEAGAYERATEEWQKLNKDITSEKQTLENLKIAHDKRKEAKTRYDELLVENRWGQLERDVQKEYGIQSIEDIIKQIDSIK